MSTATETLLIPAHLITCGDVINNHVVTRIQTDREGDREYVLVVPYTTHTYTLKVAFKDLEAVSFPVSKRGDSYSPNTRNAALGLPLVAPAPYVAPEPIARYAVGTKMSEVRHFDRSMHIVFKCPNHGTEYSSKDPYCSSWFRDPMAGECPPECGTRADDMIVSREYLPTRNG